MLVNLAEEPEYGEKLMYAQRGMVTPAPCHRQKKEDIICRWGVLAVQLWASDPRTDPGQGFQVKVDGGKCPVASGKTIALPAGSRVTLTPGVYHAFQPASDECITGEVSTANDDRHDNFFVREDIGRYPRIDEAEPPVVRLLSDPRP